MRLPVVERRPLPTQMLGTGGYMESSRDPRLRGCTRFTPHAWSFHHTLLCRTRKLEEFLSGIPLVTGTTPRCGVDWRRVSSGLMRASYLFCVLRRTFDPCRSPRLGTEGPPKKFLDEAPRENLAV